MRHCVVVDDSSVVRKVARRILEDLGFAVSEAEDGEQALGICQRVATDLVLVDWSMPIMDGVEFLTALRGELSEEQQPKAIFCTSEYDVAQIARAMRAGANTYLMKPFEREHVEAKLHEIGFL